MDHAIASPMSQPKRSAISIAAISTTFIRTGAAAAATNRPPAFSSPDSSAVSDMNKI